MRDDVKRNERRKRQRAREREASWQRFERALLERTGEPMTKNEAEKLAQRRIASKESLEGDLIRDLENLRGGEEK